MTATRLLRELRALGYSDGYMAVKELAPHCAHVETSGFEVRFETPPGRQAQVDFAHFRTVVDDAPGTEHVVWLFSLVLGHSRRLWGRFVLHPGSPEPAAMSRCRLHRTWRRAGADPLRPDAYGVQPRRSCRWPEYGLSYDYRQLQTAPSPH